MNTGNSKLISKLLESSCRKWTRTREVSSQHILFNADICGFYKKNWLSRGIRTVLEYKFVKNKFKVCKMCLDGV